MLAVIASLGVSSSFGGDQSADVVFIKRLTVGRYWRLLEEWTCRDTEVCMQIYVSSKPRKVQQSITSLHSLRFINTALHLDLQITT